jgi:myo-inositol-1(or 4)-monophosphatase
MYGVHHTREDDDTMDPILETAMEAARRAGELIVRASRDMESVDVDEKGHNDFVSDVDRRAEEAIIATIHERFSGHAVHAEEGGQSGASAYTWIIDPLDGTTNFLHGYPQYAISIAVAHEGRIAHAVVYDPLSPEMFTASRGGGAHLYGMPLGVSTRTSLGSSLLGTGFPFKAQHHLDAYLSMFRTLFPRSRGIRRAGSAALDLAYVAAGRLDGFWEIGLEAWDIAAGSLLVEEAGGRVGDFSGGDGFLLTGNVVAGNPAIYGAILDSISPFVDAVIEH